MKKCRACDGPVPRRRKHEGPRAYSSRSYCSRSCCTLGLKRTTVERFLERVTVGAGCWLWLGKPNGAGYGMISHNGRGERAHRVSWMLHRGAIPDGISVLHHCDNRMCVNPAHLFLGTIADNNADMCQKGRARYWFRVNPPRGVKHHRAKLTDADVVRIREAAKTGLSHRAIAETFGVSRPTVTRVVAAKGWKHVEVSP